MKKVLALIIAVIMSLSFVGCNETKNIQKTDLSKPVTISWVMSGPGEQADSQKVWAKFNEELKKHKGFENVSVEFTVIPFADYSQKFMLMQTSGDQIDIVQTYSLDYASEFRNGSLLDLTDYLPLMKDALSLVPEWVPEMGKVDGGQAIIPNYQGMISAPWALYMPKALADKYADVEKISEIALKSDYLGDEYYQEIEKYLVNCKTAGEIGTGFVGGSSKGTESIIDNYGYNTFEDGVNIINLSFGPVQTNAWKWKRAYYEKGLVRKDALAAKASEDNGKVGGNATWVGQSWREPQPYNSVVAKTKMETVVVPFSDKYFIPYKPTAGGLAVHSSSQYPDVAVMFMNLIMSEEGKGLYNLLTFGIEGEHYEVIKTLEDGDKVIKPNGYVTEPSASAPYGLCKWITGNAKNAYMPEALGTESIPVEEYKKFNFDYLNEGEDTSISKLMGFALDATTIETKLTAARAVHSEYGGPLGSGAVDYDSYIEEYKTKIEVAGNSEIIEEIQRQVDEFMAKK